VAETPLERIRKLEADRQQLKQQALAKALEGVAELNAMGFHYELRERRQKSGKKGKGSTNSDSNGDEI
jgi:hypothetical protein